ITLSNLRRGVTQAGTIGYWMGLPYVRRGHMAEAVDLILEFAFEGLGLHRVEAACLVHNEPSSKLLLKLGFSEEGLAREYLRIDGRWQDHRTFGILRSDRKAKS
ncbi:MAG: GNAT family protein, partial [Pseudomonadota bacterium]|nr:GNAT family protein [Pseudomonadota bacterium]